MNETLDVVADTGRVTFALFVVPPLPLLITQPAGAVTRTLSVLVVAPLVCSVIVAVLAVPARTDTVTGEGLAVIAACVYACVCVGLVRVSLVHVCEYASTYI